MLKAKVKESSPQATIFACGGVPFTKVAITTIDESFRAEIERNPFLELIEPEVAKPEVAPAPVEEEPKEEPKKPVTRRRRTSIKK